MRLEIIEVVVVEGYENLEEHNKLVEEEIKKLNPEYYTVETDLVRLVWRTEITVMNPTPNTPGCLLLPVGNSPYGGGLRN